MARCLVTGGAGFVGRRLVRRLLERGDEVTVVDSLIGGAEGFKWPLEDRLVFSQDDCRDWFKWGTHRPTRYDYAFHLAAIVGGRETIENNPLAVADDLSIDASFWQWAVRARPGKCVIFSSSAAYPTVLQSGAWIGYELAEEDINVSSTTIGMPDLTYGWSKLTVEYLARLAYEKHGLKSICFRPFSGYGEDQDMCYPFPSLARKVLDYRDHSPSAIEVWGTGQQSRDFIYIEDCIDGVLHMMDQIDDGGAVNLSTGIGTSFNDLIYLMAEMDGCAIAPQIKPMSDKPSGVFHRVGDTAKQRSLGFSAQTPLREGIVRVLENLRLTGAGKVI